MTGLEILKDLVSINTVNPPGNEKAAAIYLKELLEPAGFACAIQELGDGRANFAAQIGKGDGPELIWNGHMDVVPAAGGWNTNPFELSGEGDKVYGRGVCDMKGGLAAMCRAALNIAEKGGPERGILKLLFVADEEDANRGLRAYLREYGCVPVPCYAIIGEPTDLEVAVAHRGVARSYVDIWGTARHAALPEDGNSPVGKLPDVLDAVSKVNQELKMRMHPVLPPPGVSVTMIQAYEKDNIVPGNVRLLTDFRILPDMNCGEAEEILRDAIARVGIGQARVTSHFFLPGGEIMPEDNFVKLCCGIAGHVQGNTKAPRAFGASCEQCFLTEAGIKTIILGPGSLAQAHTRDEYLILEQLEQAVTIYEQIAQQLLGRG